MGSRGCTVAIVLVGLCACDGADVTDGGVGGEMDGGRPDASLASTVLRSCGPGDEVPPECPADSVADEREGWLRITVPDARARGAVCNDGCPASFYVRPGLGADANRWIVFLKGGVQCADVEEGGSCATRWCSQRSLMTPHAESWRPPPQGVFARRSDNAFSDWSIAFVHYCSSDSWTGTGEATPERQGVAFRGSVIVRAVLDSLAAPPGDAHPSIDDASEVILAGASAGASGVRHNIDWLRAHLDSAVRVVGVADAAHGPELMVGERRDPERRPQREEIAALYGAVFDESCEAAEPDPTVCGSPTLVITDHVTTEMFVAMDQFDSRGLGDQGVLSTCIVPECDAATPCSGGRTCSMGICRGPVCDAATPCADGVCHETGSCYATQCDDATPCPDGATCVDGLCGRAPTTCTDDGDCGAEEVCAGGRCESTRACRTQADCPAGHECIEDTNLCLVTGCGPDAPCAADEVCLGRRHMPTAQRYAAAIRDELTALPPTWGVFSSRTGTHTVISSDKFYNVLAGPPGGQLSMHDVLANWYFGRPGPTRVIDQP